MMAKIIATIKAIITRLVFAAHGFIAIWQVTIFKKNSFYWYLSSPILLLFFEGLFTLTIKENQEWKWFCPSVFLYLTSVVPAIWLLELDKVDRRLRVREEFNLTGTAGANLKEINNLIGIQIKLPDLALSTDTWITLVEQFLMLILIIGRWMLPKGDLTRDQLSQLLLVYIGRTMTFLWFIPTQIKYGFILGTAADIIEFFDSFKDDKIAEQHVLVLLTLAIWSWSLMQFTVVLTATKSRKSRLSTSGTIVRTNNCCCSIDVWGIALNITLQDAPFLVFRLLIITHFKIISYMNVFFTCKNTLVILLQLYRLYVVYSENRKKEVKKDHELTSISIISKPDMYDGRTKNRNKKHRKEKSSKSEKLKVPDESECTEDDDFSEGLTQCKKSRKPKNSRKDTGYSTGSSHTSTRNNIKQLPPKKSRESSKSRDSSKERDVLEHKKKDSKHREKQKLKRSDKDTKGHRRADAFSEESGSELSYYDEEKKIESRKSTPKKSKKKAVSMSTSEASSE